jgi:pyridoxine 5-phosphate synthase
MRLAVKLDHVATLREARRSREPEPVAAAILAELAGAGGVSVHLRADRRHIKERDLELLRQVVTTRFDVEVAATAEMARVILQIRPDQVTLVPERPQELTTEGGLDVVLHAAPLKGTVRHLQQAGIRVAVFVDPSGDQIRKAKSVGADAVVLNTFPYVAASPAERSARLEELGEAGRLAARQELEVQAGHGLTYINVRPLMAVPHISEVRIGHAIVARAVLLGMERAVREMIELLAGAPRP